MSNVYQEIKKLEQSIAYVATVIEGSNINEKILIQNDEVIWTSDPCEFLKNHVEEILAHSNTTTFAIDGQRVYCEKIGHPLEMVICGGGHVSMPIIQLARKIGFHVTVLEDRPLFADHARKAGADQVICNSFENAMDSIEGSTDTYFVIVTRGHQFDSVCLQRALKKPNAYIGMMGSSRRVKIVMEQLKEQGYDPEALNKVHSPIGLKIKAETPEEIAVSIIAEIIQVKNLRRSVNGFDHKMLEHLIDLESPQGMAMATIVSRKGSAPREVGTKMLIFEDGSTVGTIGGGCVESDVISESLQMLRQHDAHQKLIPVNMMNEEAAQEGMVCGGIVEVYIEEINR